MRCQNSRVCEVNLTDDIYKREDFAQEEVDRVTPVTLGGVLKVRLDECDPVQPVLLVNEHEGVGQVPHQHLHQTALHVLPHDPGKVERGGLDEQNEHHPLVVTVMDLQ